MFEDKSMTALVTAEQRGSFTVRLEGRELPALAAGKLAGEAASRLDFPVVGDDVAVSLHDGGAKAVIHGVLPRRSILLRKELGAAGDAQPLAANIDKVFIVMGLDGNYNIARLERLLVAAWDSGALPVVVLTKRDLCPEAELAGRLAAVELAAPGARVLCLSSLSGDGVAGVEAELAGGVRCCFVGSSGAGKTTLLNRLAGREAAATGAVREGDSRGRHTTTARQLYFLPCGGQVIDTPGVREFGVAFAGEGLATSFSDIRELAAGCRFKDCSHSGEPGCAVAAAVEAGTLPAERLKSYNKLRRETERQELRTDLKKRLAANRRLRSFGRMVRDINDEKRRLRGG
ncbi:MAG: ribosome small subunit-dependent GTPase A [Elusimicrobia bacterium GWA2_56_46]|nr:MAG: ribosome small subunit-dependent GTPase A [Elusimicrobia bacterium GWA2_56_46]OGR54775.1 MAG: ribosome small subunit-dependent GTPase A [Elusimicrobia bacterium GWC2_56_31]HBB67389.1 ribosome small subunit-dependent GTPase A [Elusimicrobiota bacterium]HBW23434.1 ribosome small subunit-dependent GTPase A [Elusimicrobiota bacterium]